MKKTSKPGMMPKGNSPKSTGGASTVTPKIDPLHPANFDPTANTPMGAAPAAPAAIISIGPKPSKASSAKISASVKKPTKAPKAAFSALKPPKTPKGF